MGSSNAIIDICKKNESGKDVLAGSFEDDDDHCLFIQVLFQEVIHHFAMTDGDLCHIFQYTVGELEKRRDAFLVSYKMVSPLVVLRINTIIECIRNLKDSYSGVKVYV